LQEELPKSQANSIPVKTVLQNVDTNVNISLRSNLSGHERVDKNSRDEKENKETKNHRESLHSGVRKE